MYSSAETLWQQVMALGLPSLAGFSVEILPEIDSTNSELMRRARAGRTEPTLLITEQQTAGRGRMGRSWQSQQGASLCFSLGLPLAPPSWEGLSLAVGLSLAQSLHPEIQIKWPNDLWWKDQKLAGVLIETTAVAQPTQKTERWAVIGVGINIATPIAQADGFRSPVCGLRDMNAQMTAQTALETLFSPLLSTVLRFEQQGFAPFKAAYAQRDALLGRQVQTSDGLQGLAKGIDSSGTYLVHTSQHIQRVLSQEISIRPV